MSAIRPLNLFALSTLAILLLSFAPSQTLAVSIPANHLARQLPNHHGIAKKKRGPKRCKPNSSSPAPNPTSLPSKDDPPKSDPSLSTILSNILSTTPSTTPSTTAPPTSVETTPPANTPTGSGKLGIAWAMSNDPRIAFLKDPKRVAMFHLWDSEIPSAVRDTGIPVSIMLWGIAQDRIDRFVNFAKPGYATHAFGFNEVNEPGQANINVDQALDAWYKYLRPRAGDGYTLGAPCTSSNPNGFDWMTEFVAKCGADCHIDEMPIHWYDVEFEDLKTYVDKWAGFGKPLRITEFACQNFNGPNQPSMDHIWDFTDKAIKFLEADGRVLSYAPFGFFGSMPGGVTDDNRLFLPGDGYGLSDLGWKYVNGY